MSRDRNNWSGQTPAISAALYRYHVFIGLDFGTTFTKVSYSVSGPNTSFLRVRTLRFDGGANGFFLPSRVWVVPEENGKWSLRMDDSTHLAGAFPVTYFKYSMVLSGLNQPEELDQALAASRHGHRLLSTFFLGCALADIRTRILTAEKLDPGNVEWYVNMGFPAGSSAPAGATAGNAFRPQRPDEDIENVFTEVLNVAWALSLSLVPDKRTASLDDLDRAYSDHQASRDDLHLNCVPELYAEVLVYYQDRNVPEGFYCVVDVGGGTTDIALFLKEIKNGSTNVKCIAHAVSPLGFESLCEKVCLTPMSNAKRKHMIKTTVPISVLGYTGRMPTDEFVDGDSFECAVHEFELAFGKHCLHNALLRQPTIVRQQVINNRNLSLFFLGGGKDVRFYHDIVSWMYEALVRVGYPPKEDKDILPYLAGMQSETRFDTKDNNRILISQMLAQPFDLIPPLDGEPWSYRPEMNLPCQFGVGVGSKVVSRTWGRGIVVRGPDDDAAHFTVQFDSNPNQVLFGNPGAFHDGYLSLSDTD